MEHGDKDAAALAIDTAFDLIRLAITREIEAHGNVAYAKEDLIRDVDGCSTAPLDPTRLRPLNGNIASQDILRPRDPVAAKVIQRSSLIGIEQVAIAKLSVIE